MKCSLRHLNLLALAALLAWLLPPGADNTTAQGGCSTTRVSVASDGTQANGDSSGGAISDDGRYVAFQSYATNLVTGDTNGVADVFVRDTQMGVTNLVSVASDGTQGNGFSGVDNDGSWSLNVSISASGRYVAFTSAATNLVAGDTNGWPDVFVHDRETGQTTLVSVGCGGVESVGRSELPSISATGRYVAFQNLAAESTHFAQMGMYVHDRGCGPVTCLSLPLVGQGASGGW